MADCGCFYCKQCYQDSDCRDDFEKLCMVCGKKKTRAFDLNDKHQYKMVERNLLDPMTFMENGRKLIEFQDLHQKRYISHLEKKVTSLQQENIEMQKELKRQRDVSLGTPSDISDLTAARGRPDIDQVTTMSFDVFGNKPGASSVLDSEVSGMERFAKVKVPIAH